MPKPEFSKINASDTALHGPRGLLLCGFGPGAQSKFESLLAFLGLSTLHRVWITREDSRQTVGDLFRRTDGTGSGQASDLPRAIVMAGIKEKELHRLMSGCRKAGMKNTLWAALTPTSEKWSLEALIDELQAERNAMTRKKKRPGRRKR